MWIKNEREGVGTGRFEWNATPKVWSKAVRACRWSSMSPETGADNRQAVVEVAPTRTEAGKNASRGFVLTKRLRELLNPVLGLCCLLGLSSCGRQTPRNSGTASVALREK